MQYLILNRTRNFSDDNEISLDTKDLILHCIVASNRIYDQLDDGLEKGTKHVVVPKIRYVNKVP
jgi:hypothetical protein